MKQKQALCHQLYTWLHTEVFQRCFHREEDFVIDIGYLQRLVPPVELIQQLCAGHKEQTQYTLLPRTEQDDGRSIGAYVSKYGVSISIALPGEECSDFFFGYVFSHAHPQFKQVVLASRFYYLWTDTNFSVSLFEPEQVHSMGMNITVSQEALRKNLCDTAQAIRGISLNKSKQS